MDTTTTIRGTKIRTTGDRALDSRIKHAEKNANGEPQQFPFDNASNKVMAAYAAHPDDAYLAEVAGSVRDHRESYRIGHTVNCRGDLYRGFCH
jgi:hypothetical protein